MSLDAQAEIAQLRAENVRQAEQIDVLVRQLAAMNDRLAELLAIAKRRKSPPARPAKPPEPPPNLDVAARTTFDERPRAPELPPKPDKVAAPRRPTGRKALPEHLPAELNLAVALSASGAHGEAIAHYRRVVARQPKNRAAQFNLAVAYAATGQAEQAKSLLRAWVKLAPVDREAKAMLDRLEGSGADAKP